MMKNWHDASREDMTLSERIADAITTGIASDASIIGHTITFIVLLLSPLTGIWSLNVMLLVFTTVVSIEAIYIGLFLQRSSNVHGKRDKVQADHDFEVNKESFALLNKIITHFDIRIDDLEGEIEDNLS